MSNIMSNKLDIIYNKYKKELLNYTYVEPENIINIPRGSYIKYFSKNLLNKKGGFLKDIKDISILELFIINKRKWFIYTDKYYIFYKIPIHTTLHDTLKSSLMDLIKNDFKIVKINNK